MSTSFVIKRTFAITVVNAYYEIKKEGNNKEDIKQFKKNFVNFIVQYMDNAYFSEAIAKRLFLSIITLEDEDEKDYTDKEWKCENYYNWSPREVEHLFISVKNYHFLNGLKNRHFEPTKEMMDIMTECDWVIEENDCCICGWHGYDETWLIKEERGKFFYSIPGNINRPVCESCVKTNCLDIKPANNGIAEDDESEIYGTVAYLEKNNLVKCGNCGNIWDGCAQCNCWQWSEYKNENEDNSEDPIHKNVTIRVPRPSRPLPVPPNLFVDKKDEKIKELEEQNKILLEELTILKQKIEELFNLTKK
jgi:hypothetical protein